MMPRIKSNNYRGSTFSKLPDKSFFVWNSDGHKTPQEAISRGFACGFKLNKNSWFSLNDLYTLDMKEIGCLQMDRVFPLRLTDIEFEGMQG